MDPFHSKGGSIGAPPPSFGYVSPSASSASGSPISLRIWFTRITVPTYISSAARSGDSVPACTMAKTDFADSCALPDANPATGMGSASWRGIEHTIDRRLRLETTHYCEIPGMAWLRNLAYFSPIFRASLYCGVWQLRGTNEVRSRILCKYDLS